MPRKGHRLTIDRGIYRDGEDGPYEIRVTVHGVAAYDRMPPDSTEDELLARRAELESAARKAQPEPARWTLRADVARYLKLIQHLSTWKDREHHLGEWVALLGDLPRHRIKEADVLAARDHWRAEKRLSNRSINHRLDTLRNLYHRLDGRRAPTPVDEVPHLKVPKTIIERVSDETILKVDRALQERERLPYTFNGAKTRARFRVFVSTGKRPCEIMRAQPSDVDLKNRVWVPRDAKGGFCPGVYLNHDMLEAWKLFKKADAWGPYNHGSFARTIRAAGWPEHIRPYQARHTTWITARERGVPLHDVATGAGHSDPKLTERMYTGILNGPLQRMSETLDGRFQRWPVVPKMGTAKSPKKHRVKKRA